MKTLILLTITHISIIWKISAEKDMLLFFYIYFSIFFFTGHNQARRYFVEQSPKTEQGNKHLSRRLWPKASKKVFVYKQPADDYFIFCFVHYYCCYYYWLQRPGDEGRGQGMPKWLTHPGIVITLTLISCRFVSSMKLSALRDLGFPGSLSPGPDWVSIQTKISIAIAVQGRHW